MNATYKTSTKEIGDQIREGGKTALRVAEDATTAMKRTAEDAADSARDLASDAREAVTDAADEGRSRLGSALKTAQDTAVEAKDAIVAGAGQTLATVRDVAVEKADAARESLSDVGERLAATLKRASDDSSDDALKSRVLTSVAQGLTSASDMLRERSVADLTSDVRSLARRHPGAFMAAAAVAGFAAARFIRSSSKRRMAELDRDHSQGPRV